MSAIVGGIIGVSVPAVALRIVALFASSAPDETMPLKDTVREVQQQARTGLGAIIRLAYSGEINQLEHPSLIGSFCFY